MSAEWRDGDLAVCVLPVGELELGCLYDVEAVLGFGRYRRDGMHGVGLSLYGVTPPSGTDAFDPRRFIRAASGTEARRAETTGSVGEADGGPASEAGDAQPTMTRKEGDKR